MTDATQWNSGEAALACLAISSVYLHSRYFHFSFPESVYGIFSPVVLLQCPGNVMVEASYPASQKTIVLFIFFLFIYFFTFYRTTYFQLGVG